MISLLVVAFILQQMLTATQNIVSWVLVKFELVVSLPAGLVAQELAANSQPTIIVNLILESCNLSVSYFFCWSLS